MNKTILTLARTVLFVVGSTIALVAILYLIMQIFDGRGILYPIIGLWLLLAYLVLPAIHQRLTGLYLPDYYIGRSRNIDGMLGDPVNLSIIGNKKQLITAMQKAGWIIAEDISLKSSIRMVYSAVAKKSYPGAPVSSLFLFGKKQEVAFQRQVAGNPRARHHVRFWKTPRDWHLPGGFRADWLGAATYDKSVGLSLYTGQITHKVGADTDKERDYVIKTLQSVSQISKLKIVKYFSSAFRAKNGGGDNIITDGSMPFITLK